MQEHFKISSDGKATSRPPGNVCFPCFLLKLLGQNLAPRKEVTVEEVRCQKNKGQGKDLDKPRYGNSRAWLYPPFPGLEVAVGKPGRCLCAAACRAVLCRAVPCRAVLLSRPAAGLPRSPLLTPTPGCEEQGAMPQCAKHR